MSTNRDDADRFINAAEAMKKMLENKYNRPFKGLGAAVKEAENRNDRIVLRHKRALDTLVDLRNVMQHSNVLNGALLATPREDAVLAIEKISDLVVNPPQIHKYMVKHPKVVASTDLLTEAAAMVITRGYSQLPVYNEGKYQALFTTNALARWLSNTVQHEKAILVEDCTTISEILEFVEDHEKPKFVRPTESAYRVCDLLSSEEPLPAVLVTTDGGENGQLQGIVTRFDVPGILRNITTPFPQ